MAIEELRQHIELKFSEAQLEFYPFPHLIIENFFPDGVFQKILDYNLFQHNVGTEWFDKKQSAALKTGTPYEARKQINFHAKHELIANDQEKEFWEEIKECFLKDRWFENLVLNKYKDYFAIRFGELIETDNFFEKFQRQLFLQRHEPGYYIGPHTDVPTRVFTCIFSFADAPGFEEYGTQLCVHKDPMVRCWGNNHYSPDDFIVRKVAPYKPNNFLLFFKTRQSFHAVKTINERVPNQRYGMQFQLYEPPQGIFTDLSAPDLLTMKHHKKETPPEGDSAYNHIKKMAKNLLSKK
ncbi:MAG: 2OG-Fe(II) oxygenase [Cyanobacteriota bacterium]|nr:2OG-Fe(II) oxygenase [Cyanobacteriota bacterium]